MDTWTQQIGFPLISIKRDGNEIIATQERFILTTETLNNSNKSTLKSKFGYKWYVPLTYITELDRKSVNHIWMNMTDGKLFKSVFTFINCTIHLVRFEIAPEVKWIKANVNQSGFYRVMYDDKMWIEIISTLRTNHTLFNPADRANLIDDVFTLSR